MHNNNNIFSSTARIDFSRLKIYSINVNSIVSIEKRASLLTFLNNHTPDVVLLGETKLNAKHKLDFEHYNMIRNDRTFSEGGGTAILLKKMISFKVINHTHLSQFKCLEATTIRLSLPNSKQLYISAMYAPKGSDFNFEFKRFFEIMHFNDNNNYYILAGDLNAKHSNWLNSVQNPRGLFLYNWIQENEIDYRCQLYGTANSSFPSHNSFLDLCIADSRLTLHSSAFDDDDDDRINILETISFDSDHCAVKISFSYVNDSIFELIRNEEIPLLNYNKMNWEQFHRSIMLKYNNCQFIENDVDNNIVPNNRNLSKIEIDQYLDVLSQITNDTIQEVVPKIYKKNSVDSYITPTIELLKREKSHLLSQLLSLYRDGRRHNDIEIVTFKSLIKNVKILIKSQLRSSVNNYWSSKIKSISKHDGHKMFPKINRIFRKKEKLSVSSLAIENTTNNRTTLTDIGINLIEDNNSLIISDDNDKLILLGNQFEKVHSQNDNLGKIRHSQIVNNITSNFDTERCLNESFLTEFTNEKQANNLTLIETENYFTTLDDLIIIFRKLNNKKSSGLDNVPNIVLKHLPSKLISQYCTLFNNALNISYFPNKWKKAKTIPLAKKGKNPSDPCSYRPISLLPNISKVFEVVLKISFTKFCDSNNIIPNCQFGFRHRHSTVHAITKFIQICVGIETVNVI